MRTSTIAGAVAGLMAMHQRAWRSLHLTATGPHANRARLYAPLRGIHPLLMIVALGGPLSIASAQEFTVKSKLLSVGLTSGGGGGSPHGLGLAASFERGAMQTTPETYVSVGGMTGYTGRAYTPGGVFENILISQVFAAIGNLHFNVATQPKLDLYSGVALGFVRASYTDDYPGSNPANPEGNDPSSEVMLALQVGGRFLFTPKVAGLIQLSTSNVPRCTIGLTLRL